MISRDFGINEVSPGLEQTGYFRKNLVSDLETENIRYINLTEALAETPSLKYHLYDMHLNSEGYYIITMELCNYLREMDE